MLGKALRKKAHRRSQYGLRTQCGTSVRAVSTINFAYWLCRHRRGGDLIEFRDEEMKCFIDLIAGIAGAGMKRLGLRDGSTCLQLRRNRRWGMQQDATGQLPVPVTIGIDAAGRRPHPRTRLWP